ncbi:EF-Tu/IF-2/RF-3 family GTPase, partial [Staphylococcus aureus]
SDKSNIGIEERLEKIVEVVPAPDGDPEAPLKALIFESEYDPYRGVISSIRMVDGVVKAGDKIRMMATGKEFEVTEVGINTPKQLPVDEVTVGDVGYIS